MRIVLLATMIMFASSAFAGLYKWVDDEGNVHYSQKRPIDKQFKKLKAPAAPAPQKSKSLYTSENNKKPSGGVVKAETAKNAKIRADNCTGAKKNLETYTLYRRIQGKDGKVAVLDDKERAKGIEDAKQAISEFCE